MWTVECLKCGDQPTDCCGGGVGATVFSGLRFTPDSGTPELFESPFQVSFGVSSFRIVDRRGFERNYDYADINGLTTQEVKTLISECKCPPPYRPNEHIEITDLDLTTPGSPTVADVEAFATANDFTDVHIYYVGGGTDGDPDWAWHIDVGGDVIRTEYPQVGNGGAGPIVRYKSGNCWIQATGFGVTYIEDKPDGNVTFTVPAGVLLLSARFWGDASNLDPTGDLKVFIDESAVGGGYNINDDDIFQPVVQKVNMNAKSFGGLSAAPYNYDISFDPTPSITDSGGGILAMKIENLSGLSRWGLIIVF